MIHSVTDESGSPECSAVKFPLGFVVATQGAIAELPTEEMRTALSRHHHGDWGEVCEEDRQENERSLREHSRLLSVFRTRSGVRFYIITEHDRSVTTILLPNEY